MGSGKFDLRVFSTESFVEFFTGLLVNVTEVKKTTTKK